MALRDCRAGLSLYTRALAPPRYSFGVANAVDGVETDGWVDRIEVGAGYWVTRNLLTKIEYVYQQYHGFGADTGVVSGVDASPSPRFNGVVLEVSWSL